MNNGYNWNAYGTTTRAMMGMSPKPQMSYGMGYQMPSPNVTVSMPSAPQPQTQPQQPSYIPGRVVTKEADITPNEVPNDGNFAVFVQQDLSTIYAKTWGGDGLIKTNVYQLVNPVASSEEAGSQDPVTMILERLDNIEKIVKNNQYQRNYHPKSKKPYRKPETEEVAKKED